MKTFLILFTGALFLSAVVASQLVLLPSAEAGLDGKCEICHLEANSDIGHVITVSRSSLDGHLKHGDCLVGDPNCAVDLATGECSIIPL